MADDPKRKLTSAEAEQVLARAASLDAEGVASGELSADEIRQSALAAGISPHAVERALREARTGVPTGPVEAGRFMGLPAIPRASAVVENAPRLTSKEIAMRLRAALGPDAVISEELGTVRARMGHTTVTVVPGASTSVSVVADQSSDIAVTAIAAGAVGFIGGLASTLAFGAGESGTSVQVALTAMLIGGAVSFTLWRTLWSRRLSQKAREAEAMAASVAAGFGEP